MVPPGSDQRVHGAGVPDLPEGGGAAPSQGRIVVLEGGNQRHYGRAADFHKGILGVLPDAVIFIPQGGNQRRYGPGIPNLSEGFRGPAPDRRVRILQDGDQRLHGSSIADLSEGIRGPAADNVFFVLQSGDQGWNHAGVPDPSQCLHDFSADGRVLALQRSHERLDGRRANPHQGVRHASPDAVILVHQGSDQRHDGTGIPDSSEGIRGPASRGRVLFLQGRDQGFDGGRTDSCQGICGAVSDGCVPVLQGTDQCPDGRAADADQGVGGILAHAEVCILQRGGKGFDGPGIPNLSEGIRGGAPNREIVILQGRNQEVDGTGILYRREGSGCIPPCGRVLIREFPNEPFRPVDIFPSGETGTEGEQDQHGRNHAFKNAATQFAFVGFHDASRTFGERNTAPRTDSPNLCCNQGRRETVRCRALILILCRECRTDGERLSTS